MNTLTGALKNIGNGWWLCLIIMIIRVFSFVTDPWAVISFGESFSWSVLKNRLQKTETTSEEDQAANHNSYEY